MWTLETASMFRALSNDQSSTPNLSSHLLGAQSSLFEQDSQVQ